MPEDINLDQDIDQDAYRPVAGNDRARTIAGQVVRETITQNYSRICPWRPPKIMDQSGRLRQVIAMGNTVDYACSDVVGGPEKGSLHPKFATAVGWKIRGK